MWQIASQAKRKTIAIIDQVTQQWKTLPLPRAADDEDDEMKEPELMNSLRSLAEKLDDSE